MTCPHCPTGPNEGYSSGAVNYKSLWTLGKSHTYFMMIMWQMATDNMIVENLSALSKPCSPSLFSVPCVYSSRVSHSLFEGVCLVCNLFYFWLHCVFVAVRGLSPVVARGGCSHCRARTSHCGELSLQNTGSSSTASTVLAQRPSSCGSHV